MTEEEFIKASFDNIVSPSGDGNFRINDVIKYMRVAFKAGMMYGEGEGNYEDDDGEPEEREVSAIQWGDRQFEIPEGFEEYTMTVMIPILNQLRELIVNNKEDMKAQGIIESTILSILGEVEVPREYLGTVYNENDFMYDPTSNTMQFCYVENGKYWLYYNIFEDDVFSVDEESKIPKKYKDLLNPSSDH